MRATKRKNIFSQMQPPLKRPKLASNMRKPRQGTDINDVYACSRKEEKEKEKKSTATISHEKIINLVNSDDEDIPDLLQTLHSNKSRQEQQANAEDKREEKENHLITTNKNCCKNQPYFKFVCKKHTFSAYIYIEEKNRLDKLGFLNDSLIDWYLHSIFCGFSEELSKRCIILHTLYYPSVVLKRIDTKNVSKNWDKCTTHMSLCEKDYIFLPVCVDRHWMLVLICFPNSIGSNHDQNIGEISKCCIVIFDSLRTRHRIQVANYIRLYLQLTRVDCGHSKIELTKDNCPMYSANCPQQSNGWACGLFVLKYFQVFPKGPLCLSQVLSKWLLSSTKCLCVYLVRL
ncbi:hypothetical protein RFI_34607 [Reticulomyxa filosa]|uniref:Ubiquitin-like protease family profile domain-containing protein n=1 Tax=Reticulomyxa filosa TaxID=46433 RepID=X6LLJ5_RETFI|nr:hypothetical protein RFI_34607 [Reticulomyxa filosa]|eukprot:ETO02808.1 hypothetical protein RFI_34607 [Reticulomyxa filosa]